MTSPVQFLKLSQGTLTMLRTPPDNCTKIEITHRAPDGSEIENTLYIHAIDRTQARIEKCSPHSGRCTPSIPGNRVSSTAGQRTTALLFGHAHLGQYLAECADTPFQLTSAAPSWVSVQDSSQLVIDAPNLVSMVGQYSFHVNIWRVTLHVEAPCSTTYLQGPSEAGRVSVNLDQQVTLRLQFNDDDRQ